MCRALGEALSRCGYVRGPHYVAVTWQEIEIYPMAEDRLPTLQQYPGQRRCEVMSYCAEGFWGKENVRSIHA
jgi:hypothetical protein